MKKSVGFFLAAFLLCTVTASTARAQDFIRNDGGLYWSVRGGLAQVRHRVTWDFGELVGVNAHREVRGLEMDLGFVAGGAVGYTLVYPGYPGALRFEVEGFYRRHDDGEVNSEWSATTDTPGSISLGHVDAPIIGSLGVTSVMGNVLMEFSTASRFSPYVGLGGGLSRIDASGLIFDINRSFWLGFPQVFDETIYALTWQGILGVGYKLSPGTMVTLEARHFRLAADRWSNLFFTEELEDVKFDDWSVGLRFTF